MILSTILVFCIYSMYIIIRTYVEEENCEAIFRRSGSEFIQETTFFFQKETKFFCFTTLIQLPIAHIKITFLIKKN
jgi:hypothetical protein